MSVTLSMWDEVNVQFHVPVAMFKGKDPKHQGSKAILDTLVKLSFSEPLLGIKPWSFWPYAVILINDWLHDSHAVLDK
jgi:hypothetical protein